MKFTYIPPGGVTMDTFNADLQQLYALFESMVATLRKEKGELHDACQQFELVYILVFCASFPSLGGTVERHQR